MRNIASVVIAMLTLAACGTAATNSEGISPDERHKMTFSIPAALDQHVDLTDKHAVAKAMGVTLTGDPKQHLYDIVMSAPSTEGRMEKRTIAIRVDNIKQGSNVIYGLEGVHQSAKKAEGKKPAKKVAKKPVAKKIK